MTWLGRLHIVFSMQSRGSQKARAISFSSLCCMAGQDSPRALNALSSQCFLRTAAQLSNGHYVDGCLWRCQKRVLTIRKIPSQYKENTSERLRYQVLMALDMGGLLHGLEQELPRLPSIGSLKTAHTPSSTHPVAWRISCLFCSHHT